MVVSKSIPPEFCECFACTALQARYDDDPVLLAMYRKKLLIPGWAGEADALEKAYIQAHAVWAKIGAEALAKHRGTTKSRAKPVPKDILPHDGCICDACQALAAEYNIGAPDNQLNEQMHQVVRRNLLVWRWAGGMSEVERNYVQAHPPKWYSSSVENSLLGQRFQPAEGSEGCPTAVDSRR